MDYTGLAKQFLHYLGRFQSHGHQRHIDETLRGELFVILYISKKADNVWPGDISKQMNISSARVAAILNNLENKGFVSRQIDKSDRRRILVHLTPEGIALAEKRNKMALNIAARTLELLGEQDAKELVRIMGSLAKLIP